jgi:hypothetical protein
MTENDDLPAEDLPAEVRRQDEEDELRVAGQLAELRKGTEATQNEDLPAEVRRQDEEDELQVAGQLAELRKGTEDIRYVDLGPTVPMLRVGYHKEHGQPYVHLVTLKGPQGNLEVACQAGISIDDALLYVRGILDAVAKALKS